MGTVLEFAPPQAPASQPRIMFGRALIHALASAASRHTGVSLEEILSRTYRNSDAAMVRFAVMLVAKERGKTQAQIGRVLNGRDHTTVMYGLSRARSLEKEDADFAELLRLLREEAAR
jgi:chromosomal replication initiation ATPase DnaA